MSRRSISYFRSARSKWLLLKVKALLLVCAVSWAGVLSAAPFVDSIDTPAEKSALAAKRPLLAVAMAGSRVVAVGERGHIVWSDDGGAHWTQAAVPVSTDLVALSFPTATKGWAVGHGGVILHSADGGKTWERQLDGRQASALAVEFMRRLPSDERSESLRRQADLHLQNAEAGAPEPFLDVLFEDEMKGFVVGTYNRIFRTEDGGKTWTPWMERVDNLRELHFYSIQRAENSVFLTGERGLVWRRDGAAQRFAEAPSPYAGTLFGSVATPTLVVAFGMRGTILVSSDNGVNWRQVAIPSRANINTGIALPDGSIVLATSSGELWLGNQNATSFELLKVDTDLTAFFSVALHEAESLALAGDRGVRIVKLNRGGDSGHPRK